MILDGTGEGVHQAARCYKHAEAAAMEEAEEETLRGLEILSHALQ